MRTSDDVLARGVWVAPWLVGGAETLVAIGSRGELVAQHVVSADTFPGEDVGLVTEYLRRLLERADPTWTRPALALVR